MKKLFTILAACLLATAAFAGPYKHAVGIVAGGYNGISYKHFSSENVAFQLDLGIGLQATQGAAYADGYKTGHGKLSFWDFDFNPNIMYQGSLYNDLYGYIGGGISGGFAESFNNTTMFGKLGANVLIGMEYKFSAPVTLGIDFRPGYACLLKGVEGVTVNYHIFDWKLNLAVRYTF